MSIFNLQSSIVNSKGGFTLLEVLFAIVLISIGLLALAGMQATALTGNRSSRDMTTATALAEEMIDRVRVNGGDAPEIYNNLNTNNCSGLTDPALGDCNQWKDSLDRSGLPGASGAVTVVTNNPIPYTATVTVTVQWGTVSTRTVRFTTIVETWVT